MYGLNIENKSCKPDVGKPNSPNSVQEVVTAVRIIMSISVYCCSWKHVSCNSFMRSFSDNDQ